jgi:tRNA-Thr(GGU) m(6)t(6)A37 methyltransferase TsaA
MTSATLSYQFQPVGLVHSCFKEKFAIPRQPALAPAARGHIELLPPYDSAEALQGLEGVSHLWLTFIFHQAMPKPNELRLKVRPPRLGGNKKVGVFSTRSTHRPNPIGLSVVKLDRIEGSILYISGIDLLDQTPVLDIKPYIPYSDAINQAENPMAPESPQPIIVTFLDSALQQANDHQQRLKQPIVALIEQMLAQDPKPAYQTPDPQRLYGVKVWDLEVKWQYPCADQIQVISVSRL